MKTKAVVYARVSTDVQSTKRQVEELQRYADQNGFTVVETFGEKISGLIADRDELTSLKDYIKEHNIKHVLCSELSRVGRSAKQTLTELDYFTKEGVNIYFKKENINSISEDSSNKFLLNILTVVADFEMSTLKDRFASGRISAKLKGRTNGIMTIPYGYSQSEQNTLIINDEEAKNAKHIFDLAIKGTSLYGICTELQSLGIPTKRGTGIWHPKVIKAILTNTIYKGLKVYQGNDIIVPSIVSEGDWDKVQDRFKNHIGYINRSIYPYLFKGKLKCGVCGRAWCSYTKKTGYSFYYCTGIQNRRGSCENGRYVNTKLIDDRVFNALFIHPDIDQTVLDDEKKKSKKEEVRKQIDLYKNEVVKTEAKLRRIVISFEDGNKTEETYKTEQITLKNSIINLNNKIKLCEKELTYETDIKLYDLLTSIKHGNDDLMKRDFVVKYVDKVEMNYARESNITWDAPLHKDDRIIYAKLYAFNNPDPVHVVMTTQTNQCNMYADQGVEYNNHKLTIKKARSK